jgi:hypothetical protein
MFVPFPGSVFISVLFLSGGNKQAVLAKSAHKYAGGYVKICRRFCTDRKNGFRERLPEIQSIELRGLKLD